MFEMQVECSTSSSFFIKFDAQGSQTCHQRQFLQLLLSPNEKPQYCSVATNHGKNENLFYLKFFQICGVRFGSLCDEDMTNSFALNEHIKKATCKSVQGRTKMSKKLRRIVKGLSLIGLESFYQRNSIHTQLHFEIIEFCEYICKFNL